MVPWYPVDTIEVPLVPRCLFSFQHVIPVTPGAMRRHITIKLDELKTVLDGGRGGWYRQIGASIAALEAEIHAFSVLFDGQTSMCPHTPIYEEI